ncbi:MAG TPA: PQQ-binding-like beta-propeller repeat protein [Trebonia sp.]|nr:PQQ-binding-like beta-propeller repeat protein [Trebonia sp.]
MYAQAEIGEDYPRPSGPLSAARPGKAARRLIIALIVGVLAGAAIMLQVKGWGTLAGEAGGACGSGDDGASYGACPRGITPALVLSFLIGLPAVPFAVALLFRRGWIRRAIVVIGAAAGLLAGQALFAVWHGTDLPVAWAAPRDSSNELATVGVWTTGDSLVRIRADQVASYAAATGRARWTLAVPGTDTACAASANPGAPGASVPAAGVTAGVGLVGYGQGESTCDHVMAVDLATGRQLWTEQIQDPYSGNDPAGTLAVSGPAAVVLTAGGLAGVDARTGAQRWTLPAPSNECAFQQLAASGTSLVAVAACDASYYVVAVDPATGKKAWQSRVSETSDSYQFEILSARPVVVNDGVPGPRETSQVRVFSAAGAMTASFSVSGLTVDGQDTSLDTDPSHGFGAPDVVAGGLLVGPTEASDGKSALVAFRLSDGRRQWLVPTPDEVHEVSAYGGEMLLVDESDPAYSLEEVSAETGALHSLGYFAQGVLQSGDSGLYPVGGQDIIVNLNGDTWNPPVAALTPPAAKG